VVRRLGWEERKGQESMVRRELVLSGRVEQGGCGKGMGCSFSHCKLKCSVCFFACPSYFTLVAPWYIQDHARACCALSNNQAQVRATLVQIMHGLLEEEMTCPVCTRISWSVGMSHAVCLWTRIQECRLQHDFVGMEVMESGVKNMLCRCIRERV
jgi:hypothetical protein